MANDPPPPANGGVKDVTVLAPLGQPPGGYEKRYLECRLTREQAHCLARLREGLTYQGEMMDNGRPVRSKEDAVKWLLERCVYAD